MLDRTELLQLQGLVQAFYRRQRQASLLVAASIATAVVLTFGGLILLFSMTGPGAGQARGRGPEGRDLRRPRRAARGDRSPVLSTHPRAREPAG